MAKIFVKILIIYKYHLSSITSNLKEKLILANNSSLRRFIIQSLLIGFNNKIQF